MTGIFVIASIPFVIARAAKQSRCPCERREATPSSLRPSSQYHKIAASASPPRNDMDFGHCEHPFVLVSAAKQSRRPCERRRNTTRLPRRLRLLAMTGIFVIARIPLSLRAQRSNSVVLVSVFATPQDCRVGFASSQ
jgi:hypothetical protein